MATCIRCAAAMREGARFCTRCGAPAVVEAPAVAAAPAIVEPPTVTEEPAVVEPPVLAEASAVVESPAVEHEPIVADDADPPRPSLAIGPPPAASPASAASPAPGTGVDGASALEGDAPSGAVLTIAPEVPPLAKGRRWTAPPVRSHAATAAFVTGVLPLLVSLLGNTLAAALTADAAAQAAGGAASGAWTPVFVTLALIFVINAALLTVCVITAGRGMRETANGITRGRGLAVAGLVVGGLNLLLWLAGLVVTLTTLSAALG